MGHLQDNVFAFHSDFGKEAAIFGSRIVIERGLQD